MELLVDQELELLELPQPLLELLVLQELLEPHQLLDLQGLEPMELLEPQELLTELVQLEPLELHMEHQAVLPALNQVPHMDNLVLHTANLAHHTGKLAHHMAQAFPHQQLDKDIKELQELQELQVLLEPQELALAHQVLDHQEIQATPFKQKDIEFKK